MSRSILPLTQCSQIGDFLERNLLKQKWPEFIWRYLANGSNSYLDLRNEMQNIPQKSSTPAQHYSNIGSTYRVCWVQRPCVTSKHETLTQCWLNVGPPSATLARHQISIGSTPRVCWDLFDHVRSHQDGSPANTKHLYNICKTLAQRPRRWHGIVQMLCNFFKLTGENTAADNQNDLLNHTRLHIPRTRGFSRKWKLDNSPRKHQAQCWFNVADGGPTLKRRWLAVSCLQGCCYILKRLTIKLFYLLIWVWLLTLILVVWLYTLNFYPIEK